MRKLLLLLFVLALCAPAAGDQTCGAIVDWAPPDENTVLGDVTSDCKHVHDKKGAPALRPQGFQISPEQSLMIARKAGTLECGPDIKSFLVADNGNYVVFTGHIVSSIEYRGYFRMAKIDGRSGRVIKVYSGGCLPEDEKQN